eukprot:10478586-Lingulodinium_polyedra.AAC.1
MAFFLCNTEAEAGQDKAGVVSMAKEAAGKVFGTFGQTKIVEDMFHQIRVKETVPGVQKKHLTLPKQLQVAHTAKVLQEHGWPEREEGLEGGAPKWSDGWFLPHTLKMSVDCSNLNQGTSNWPSYTPQSSLGLIALQDLLRDCHSKGPLDQDAMAQ